MDIASCKGLGYDMTDSTWAGGRGREKGANSSAHQTDYVSTAATSRFGFARSGKMSALMEKKRLNVRARFWGEKESS